MDERDFFGEDTIRQFRLNAPARGWFPALRNLSWTISTAHLPYVDLFLSPHLNSVQIHIPPSWSYYGFPCEILPALNSTISALPASALQRLSIDAGASLANAFWAHFKDSFSSVVLRCGPSLVSLVSQIPLSDEAFDHVIRLPHLRTLHVECPPPNCSPSSPPLVFPPLIDFGLGAASTSGWLSLFRQLEVHTSATQDMTPFSRMKESLRALSTYAPSTAHMINDSLISATRMFRNLVYLDVGSYCDYRQCAFKLNNENVAELSIALPQLKRLDLGSPCYENTCATTVACLFLISIHCLGMIDMKIHFNTTDIVGDLKNISVDPRFQELRTLPRCQLWYLDVSDAPLVLDETDFEFVVDGMKDIFPCLRWFGGPDLWDKLSKKLRGYY